MSWVTCSNSVGIKTSEEIVSENQSYEVRYRCDGYKEPAAPANLLSFVACTADLKVGRHSTTKERTQRS